MMFMVKKVSWMEAQILNSKFLSTTNKKYGKKFIVPAQAEKFREKRGLRARPLKFTFI